MGSVVTARVVQPESAGAGEECRGGTGRLPTGMVGLLGTADSAGAGDGMTNAGVEIAAGGPWRRALTCATWEVLCSPSRQPCTRAACCKGKDQGAKVGVRVQESNESDESFEGEPRPQKYKMARALATTDRTAKCESLLTILLVVVCFQA